MCSPCSGARCSAAGWPSNCTGTLGSENSGPPSVSTGCDVAVRDDLGIGEQLVDGLHRCPRRVEPVQQLAPLLERALGELALEDLDTLGAVLARGS